MTSREQALIAINEALRALDFVPELPPELDNQPAEAQIILAGLRSHLTDLDWPELPALNSDSDEYRAWFELRAIGQRREGLL